MDHAGFVYTTYIKTTPEELWTALIDPAFTSRYWGGTRMQSDWEVGSAVLWERDGEFRDVGSVVLAFEPPRRLSYSWHDLSQAHADFFGWSEDRFAEVLQEPRSKVTFEIEAMP